jgi:hypothetical protein
MAKRYIRLNWQNSPSVATPVNAVNLNAMDKGIDDLDNAIEDLYSVKFDKANIVQQATVNDAAKVPSTAVTYSLAQSVQLLNDNLVAQLNGYKISSATVVLNFDAAGMAYFNHVATVGAVMFISPIANDFIVTRCVYDTTNQRFEINFKTFAGALYVSQGVGVNYIVISK